MLAILGGVLLIDAAPMWGADVGGALAGLPALALVAMGLGQWKVRWRVVVLAAVATLVLIGALGALDLTRDSADRSHLGRLFERIGSDGWSGLSTVVERKLAVNLRSLTESTWRYLFGPLAIAAGLMLWRGRDWVRAVTDAFPPLRRAMPGLDRARRPRLRSQRLGHRRAGRHAGRRRPGRRLPGLPRRADTVP